MADMPSPCPCCGAYSLDPSVQTTTLLAVCDVLVLKALEKIGSYLVREDRGRFRMLASRPHYLAHTLWPVPDAITTRVLRGAWDVVPPLVDVHGCCGITSLQVTAMLDEYVHDLVLTGTEHCEGDLRYRFETRLGLVLPSTLLLEPALELEEHHA